MQMESHQRANRIDVIDAIRGFALCGILLINLPHMSWLIASDDPVRGIRDGGFSTALWWVQMLLVNGNMRGLFSLLFGASMLLFLAKAERGSATRAEANRLMIRRLFWLFVFGVINSTIFLWPGDILMIYGMAGLLVLPFATVRPRTLLIGAAVIITGLSIYFASQQLSKREVVARGPQIAALAHAGRSLPDHDKKILKTWREMTTGKLAAPAEVASERADRLGGYPANLRFMSKTSWQWFLDWKDTLRWVFDAAAFMLIGMWLYRRGWLQGDASRRNYLAVAAIGYGFGVPLKAIEAVCDWHYMTGSAPTFASLFWVAGATLQPARLLVTLGHAGLFLWFWKTFKFRLAGLQALGKMAFTGYLMQSILAGIAFSGFGLALWGRLSLAELWLTAAIIWTIEILFAQAWLSRFAIGPFEWVWRSLTYGRRAPMLRLSPAS
jgi:uncharacterized protein